MIPIDTHRLSVRPFSAGVLKQTYAWLHDPEIQELTRTPDFTEDQQLLWLNNLPARTDCIVKAIYLDDEIIGAWGLKNINKEKGDAEQYYYIGNKNYWGQGIGEWLMDSVQKAALDIGLSRIYLSVVMKNFKAINLCFKNGFKIIGWENDLFKMEKFLR